MRVLKLIVGLGGLSTQMTQNLLASSNSISSSERNHYHAVFVSDEADYEPPIISVVRQSVIVNIPSWKDSEFIQRPIANLPNFVSRRSLRQHFLQHQVQFWKPIHALLKKHQDSGNTQVAILIDTSNAFASSICWDVLCQLRVDFPQVRCYPVFLVPKQINAVSAEVQLNVAALLSEFNAFGQKAWLPLDLETQKPYAMENMSFWSSSFLSELPDQNDVGFDYGQLVEQVTNLPQQKINLNTLEQLIEEDFKKLHDKKKVMLPRIVSLNQASLQLDMAAVQKLLTQNIQIQLLNLLSQPTHSYHSNPSHEKMLEAGWVVKDDVLLLNESNVEIGNKAHESIEKEWETRGNFFVKQVQDMNTLSWKEKTQELVNLFQKAYDKHFRTTGVPLYYSLSETRLERMAQFHAEAIEANIWKSCLQNDLKMTDLPHHVASILNYYTSLIEAFELKQRRVRDAYLKQQVLWDEVITNWERAGRRDRTRIEQEPLSELAEILKSKFIYQSEEKALAFAVKLADALLPKYQNIADALSGMKRVWHNQIEVEKTNLKILETQCQQAWIAKQWKNGIHQYLLQPTNTTAAQLLQICKVDLNDWVPEILGTWLRRQGETGHFDKLSKWMDENQWQSLIERISAQVSYRLANNLAQAGMNPLSLMFEQRLTTLTQSQILQLSKHAIESMTQQYQKQWRPLGKALTEDDQRTELMAILCALDFRDPAAEASVMWMKDAARYQQQSVMVIPMGEGNQIQFTSLVTGYLQEWRPLNAYVRTYKNYTQDDEALEHVHVDGSASQLRIGALGFHQRNLDLVRQQLLLAKILGYLQKNPLGCYQLHLSAVPGHKAAIQEFQVGDLAELVEVIPLEMVRLLMDQNRYLRETQPVSHVVWNKVLDEALEELRREYVPQGMDLADLDWKEAGRYVVWTRSVQNLRKHWLSPSKNRNVSAGA